MTTSTQLKLYMYIITIIIKDFISDFTLLVIKYLIFQNGSSSGTKNIILTSKLKIHNKLTYFI